MIASDLIDSARLMTFDTLPDQQTWTDDQYLTALNDGLAFLYSRLSESRATENVGVLAFIPIAMADLGQTMLEDDTYWTFCVEFMACAFFSAGSRDTANRQKAADHHANWMQAIMPSGGK